MRSIFVMEKLANKNPHTCWHVGFLNETQAESKSTLPPLFHSLFAS